MKPLITELEIEQVALDILSELKYKVIYGSDIAKRIKKMRSQI